MLGLNYQKRNNTLLFKDLEKQLEIENCQNYIPLYNKLFQLNSTNYKNINLDNEQYIYKLNNKLDNLYSYNSTIRDNSNNDVNLDVFFKLSPLLDPLKYAIGKYDISDVNLLEIPNFLNNNSHAKTRDMNNSAYVDGFFSYLSSKLVKKYNFVHGLNYYGSFLGTKNNFIYNACDEIELLLESKFFHDNKNKLFVLDDRHDNINSDSRCYKAKLYIDNVSDISEFDIIEINDNVDNGLDELKNEDKESNVEMNENNEFDLLILENINDLVTVCKPDNNSTKSKSNFSDCSSRTSHTSNNSDEEGFENNDFSDDEASYETMEDTESTNDDDDDSDVTDLTMSTDLDENINLTINKFPISVICLEKCEDTLDSYMYNNDNDIPQDEWGSIFMQIIMTLITYNKLFNFTHNDLHTNNIMYSSTDKKFLYYKINNTYYKVPTFGKIYKIIDFGRAIYKYNDFNYCSDSFHKNGDASTQYNFEPYMNNKKPRLEPNFSFDLCRLACSLYDYICNNEKKDNKVTLLIKDWCKDDKGRNVLYKTNGDERYPDFKLYKMIVRTVHNHTPENQLKREMFSRYVVSKNKIKKSDMSLVMDIDTY